MAIFLHMHLCRYLAEEAGKCAFLPQGVYEGRSFDVVQRDFDKYVEMEKERRLRALFWENRIVG